MSDKQETIADIIAEMCGTRTEFPFVYLIGEPDTPEVIKFTTKEIVEPRKINIRRVTVKELADRLGAALKREREASGDCAKMREALKPWIAFAEWLLENAGKDGLGRAIREDGPIIRQRLEELHAALSAPPRQCDVGTAEEQVNRHKEWCVRHACKICMMRYSCRECFAKWAQIPYRAEEGGNE